MLSLPLLLPATAELYEVACYCIQGTLFSLLLALIGTYFFLLPAPKPAALGSVVFPLGHLSSTKFCLRLLPGDRHDYRAAAALLLLALALLLCVEWLTSWLTGLFFWAFFQPTNQRLSSSPNPRPNWNLPGSGSRRSGGDHHPVAHRESINFYALFVLSTLHAASATACWPVQCVLVVDDPRDTTRDLGSRRSALAWPITNPCLCLCKVIFCTFCVYTHTRYGHQQASSKLESTRFETFLDMFNHHTSR